MIQRLICLLKGHEEYCDTNLTINKSTREVGITHDHRCRACTWHTTFANTPDDTAFIEFVLIALDKGRSQQYIQRHTAAYYENSHRPN